MRAQSARLTGCTVALKCLVILAAKCSYIRSVHYSCHASQYLRSAELHLLPLPLFTTSKMAAQAENPGVRRSWLAHSLGS